MASLQRDPSGQFHISFRFGGMRFKRSLKTKHRRKADAACVRVEENIRLHKLGRLVIPEEADIPTFLLSDGQVHTKVKTQPVVRIGELFELYERAIPADALEPESLRILALHMRHFARVLGKRTSVKSITTATLQKYVTIRSKEKGKHGNNLSAATIRKELASLGSLWNWAMSQEIVTKPFPKKGIVFPKQNDKPSFQTWTQIRTQIERRNLSVAEQTELWDCLYLDRQEIDELLETVNNYGGYGFLYPMTVFAAHTGARRSELCRSQAADFDFNGGTVVIRERKRARSKRTTRVVPLSKLLRTVMADWLELNRGSFYTFPEEHRVSRVRKTQVDEGCVTPDEASTQLNRAIAGTKWENLRGWHTFRHSFISNCATQAIDQRFIDAWVGHQTDEQRRRYRHLFPDSQQDAIDSVFH